MKVLIQGQTLLILLLTALALVTIISVPASARPPRLEQPRRASHVNMTAPARRDLHPKEAEALLKAFEAATRVLESRLENMMVKASIISFGSPSPPSGSFIDPLNYNIAHERLALQVYSMFSKGPEHGYSPYVEGGSRGSGDRELPRPY